MRRLGFCLVLLAAALAPTSAAASTIDIVGGVSTELAGSVTLLQAGVLSLSCTHTFRLTETNLRIGTGINTSVLIDRTENALTGCTFRYLVLGCAGTANAAVESNWTLTAGNQSGGLTWTATLELPNPSIRITLVGGCVDGCVLTLGRANLATNWEDRFNGRLTFPRQNVPYVTGGRTCLGIAGPNIGMTGESTESIPTITMRFRT